MQEPDADLVAAFRADLAERMDRIAANWAAVDAGDAAALEPLLRDIHYLSGTAATFGSPDIGDAAARVEGLLWPIVQDGAVPADRTNLRPAIAALAAIAG